MCDAFHKRKFSGSLYLVGGNIIQIRLHIGIATIFVILVTALTAIIIWTNHREASSAAKKTADLLFQENSAKVDERLNRLLDAVKATVDTASALPSLAEEPVYDGLAYPALTALIEFLDNGQREIISRGAIRKVKR